MELQSGEALASAFQAIMVNNGRLEDHDKLYLGHENPRKILIDKVVKPLAQFQGVSPEQYILRLVLESAYDHDPFEAINTDLKEMGSEQSIGQLMTGFDDLSIHYG